MNTKNLKEQIERLHNLESMILQCKENGGRIKVGASSNESEVWVETCMVNSVKDAIREIYEREAALVRRSIKELANA